MAVSCRPWAKGMAGMGKIREGMAKNEAIYNTFILHIHMLTTPLTRNYGSLGGCTNIWNQFGGLEISKYLKFRDKAYVWHFWGRVSSSKWIYDQSYFSFTSQLIGVSAMFLNSNPSRHLTWQTKERHSGEGLHVAHRSLAWTWPPMIAGIASDLSQLYSGRCFGTFFYSYGHLSVITGYKWDYIFYKWGYKYL